MSAAQGAPTGFAVAVAVADVVGVGGEDDDGAEDEEGGADDWAVADDTPEAVLVALRDHDDDGDCVGEEGINATTTTLSRKVVSSLSCDCVSVMRRVTGDEPSPVVDAVITLRAQVAFSSGKKLSTCVLSK